MKQLSREEASQIVTTAVVDELKIPESEVTNEAHLVNDLSADSLSVTAIVIGIEDGLEKALGEKLLIPDDDVKSLLTREEIVDYIVKRCAESA